RPSGIDQRAGRNSPVTQLGGWPLLTRAVVKRRCLESLTRVPPSGGTLVASRREIRTQHELALETAGFKTSVRLGNFIQRDPLGDPRRDGATGQQSEQVAQVRPEPCWMLQPRRFDGVEAGSPSTRQPPPEIQPHNPHQHDEHASLALYARRV